MSSNGFSCISSTSASPSASLVRRAGLSNFCAFFCGAAFFPDIAALFVQDQSSSRKSALTPAQLNLTVQIMTDNRMSAAALIAGVIGTIITMAFHPTAHDLMSPEQLAHGARISIATHTLALIVMPVFFLGALALSKQLNAPNRLALAALVLYGFGVAA